MLGRVQSITVTHILSNQIKQTFEFSVNINEPIIIIIQFLPRKTVNIIVFSGCAIITLHLPIAKSLRSSKFDTRIPEFHFT